MNPTADKQTILVLWGASGVGRAIAVALARAGARVIISDPDRAALKKLQDQLEGKKALVSTVPWASGDDIGTSLGEAAAEVLDAARELHPNIHRIVVATGTDPRFWEAFAANPDPTHMERVNAGYREMIVRCREALATQRGIDATATNVHVLWPASRGVASEGSPREAAWVRGRGFIDGLSSATPKDPKLPAPREAGARVPVSVLSLGPVEGGPWSESAEVPLLKPGEIGDAFLSLIALPRRVLARETILTAR